MIQNSQDALKNLGFQFLGRKIRLEISVSRKLRWDTTLAQGRLQAHEQNARREQNARSDSNARSDVAQVTEVRHWHTRSLCLPMRSSESQEICGVLGGIMTLVI